MKTYIVKYDIYLNDGSIIKDKEIKVKNCLTDLQAKIKLDGYVKSKNANVFKIVIHSCVEDIFGLFGNMFGGNDFNNLFGKGFKK